MRLAPCLAVLLLAACTPAAPPASPPASAPAAPSAIPADPYVAALSAAPASGQWAFLGEDATISAGFGESESEYQLVIVCNSATGALAVDVSHELAPDQATTLRLVTATQTLDLPARSHNQGLPSVRADIARDAPQKLPLIGMLGAPTDRFAIDIAGELTVFPWNDAIARALIECRD
jgi:hypothetical protein